MFIKLPFYTPNPFRRPRPVMTTAEARRYRRRPNIPLPVMVILVVAMIPLAIAVWGRINRGFIIPHTCPPLELLYSDSLPRVHEASHSKWVSVSGRFKLYPGDEFASGNAQRLIFSLDDLHSLRLGPQTVIKELRADRGSDGGLSVRISLYRGRLWLEGMQGRRMDWMVELPQARIIANNAVCEVSLSLSGLLTIRVWRGSVEFFPLADTSYRTFIMQGQMATITASGRVSATRDMSPEELSPWQAWNLKTSLQDARADRVPTLTDAFLTASGEVRQTARRLTSLYYKVDASAPPSGGPSNLLAGTQARSTQGLLGSLGLAGEPRTSPDSPPADPGAAGARNSAAAEPGANENPPGPPSRAGGSDPSPQATDSNVNPDDSEDVYNRASGQTGATGGKTESTPATDAGAASGGGEARPRPEPTSLPPSGSNLEPPGYRIGSTPAGQGGAPLAMVDVPGYRVGSRPEGPSMYSQGDNSGNSPSNSGQNNPGTQGSGSAPGQGGGSAGTPRDSKSQGGWEDAGCNTRWSGGRQQAPRIMIRQVTYRDHVVACDLMNDGGEAAKKVKVLVTHTVSGKTRTESYSVGDLEPRRVFPVNFRPAAEGENNPADETISIEYLNP